MSQDRAESLSGADRYVGKVEAFDMRRYQEVAGTIGYLGQNSPNIAAILTLVQREEALTSTGLYDALVELHANEPITGYSPRILTHFLMTMGDLRFLHRKSVDRARSQDTAYTVSTLGRQVLVPAAGYLGQLFLSPEGFPVSSLFTRTSPQNRHPFPYNFLVLSNALDQRVTGCSPLIVSKAYDVILGQIRQGCRALAAVGVLEENASAERYWLKPEHENITAGITYVVAGLMTRDDRVIAQGTVMAESLGNDQKQLALLTAA